MTTRPGTPSGEALVNTCGSCGAPNAAGDRYCSGCGAVLSLDTDAALLMDLQQVTLGEYEIVGILGKGGMGLVFLANDLALNRKVAIKVLPPEMLQGDASVERFRREARIAASLRHRNITSVFGLKETTRVVFFIMEFVQGGTLHGLLHAVGRLEIDAAEAVLYDAAGALTYAHRRDVVHRDLKPSNLLVDVEGMTLVTDFGVAKLSTAQGLTTTGSAIGSPKYMSPEQWSGKATAASDQYSLGCVAYEILTGRAPFEGESLQELLKQHLMDAPEHVLVYRPDCPPQIAAGVMRMLEKDPSNRFSSVEAAIEWMGIRPVSPDAPVRRSLASFAAEGDKIRPLPKTPKSPIPKQSTKRGAGRSVSRWRSRGLTWIAGGVAGMLALAGVTAYLIIKAPIITDRHVTDSLGGDAIRLSATPRTDSVQTTAQRQDTSPPPLARPVVSESTSAKLEVTPPSARLAIGKSIQLAANLVNADGKAEPQRGIHWSSSNADVAAISPRGKVTANHAGSSIITAEQSGRRAVASITVIEPTLSTSAAHIEVTPHRMTLDVNSSQALHVSGMNAKGKSLDAQRVQWTSTNPAVAAVSSNGSVVGVKEGSASISATVDGITSAPVEVTVSQPAPTVGVVRMIINPWANFFLDGKLKGQRTRGEDTLTSNVEHHLRFERDGFAPLDTTIVLKANEQRLMRILLLPRTP